MNFNFLFLLTSVLFFCACQNNTQSPPSETEYPQSQNNEYEVYSRSEIIDHVSGFFGTTSESAGSVVESVFKRYGEPVGYITGNEGSAAFALGLRYGSGYLWMKNGEKRLVYWQGPSIGWDFGGNLVKVFTLVYNMKSADQIYRRFPGIEGSAYFIAGLGVNFQKAEEIILAPIRSGVGLRLGGNIGYLSYSKKRHFIPF